jgi:hypothetical protein
MDQAVHPRGGALYRPQGMTFGLVIAVGGEDVVVLEDAKRELDGGHRRLEVVGHDGHEVLAKARGLFGRLVEERVVDRMARAASHIHGQLEVAEAVATLGLGGGGEEEGAERAAARHHRGRDGGQWPQQPRAAGPDLAQAILVRLHPRGDELRLSRPDGPGQRMIG